VINLNPINKGIQTGLPRILKVVFTVLIFFLYFGKIHAQVKISARERKSDNRIIEKYIDQANKEIVIEDLDKEERSDKALIDSLIRESNTRYTEGRVTYSPDKKFRIFVIDGEGCGGTCTCFHDAFFYVAGSKIKQYLNEETLPVDAIFKLEDGKYLVLEKDHTCGGNVRYDYKKAILISFKNNKIIFHQFNYADPRYPSSINNKGMELSLEQLEDDNDDMLLKFDPRTKILSYRYKANLELCCNAVGSFTYSGYFRYEKGRFVHKKETKTEINN
jgi:hypothetical protein